MPTSEPPAPFLNKIEGCLAEVNAAYATLSECQSNPEARAAAQTALVAASRRLTTAAQAPHEAAIAVAMGDAVHPCFLAASNCGILKAWPSQELSADQLASMTGADKRLVVRIMRVLLVSGIFEEVGEEIYSHNDLSRALCNPGMQTIVNWMNPAMCKLPAYLALTSYRNPGANDESATLFQYANQTPLSFYEALAANETARRGFDMQMAALIASERQRYRSGFANLWDFEGQISGLIKDEQDVAIVDVGGSKGHVLEDVRKHLPHLPGRLILEELPSTLAQLQPADGIEAVPYDFLREEQPVKGAAVYLFRQVFLNWCDSKGKKILQNTLPAMEKAKSKLLIVEPVLPAVGARFQPVMLDLQMMQMSGGLRTQKQWTAFLDDSGFRVNKFWPTNSNQTVIEAVPKGF